MSERKEKGLVGAKKKKSETKKSASARQRAGGPAAEASATPGAGTTGETGAVGGTGTTGADRATAEAGATGETGAVGGTGTASASGGTRLKRRPWWVRTIMAALALFTVWHILASFLWIAPAGPARDIVPGTLLSKYMLPMFGQSWSVFAPEPINGDNRMFVRAAVTKGGKESTTEWLPVTDIESQLMTHELFPARAGNQSITLASDYRSAYQKLDKAQQRIVGLGYFRDGWTNRLEADLKNPVDANGKPVKETQQAAVAPYLDADYRTARYSLQVARAIWGDGVTRVQYRVERQNVIPFDQRNNPDAKRPAVQYTPTGWRGVQVAAHQSDEDFAKTFRKLYREYQDKHPDAAAQPDAGARPDSGAARGQEAAL